MAAVRHSHWWSYIAPYFTRDFRVAAIDLSGMGGERTTIRSFAPKKSAP
jgi:pimeloyl-ACP methyl ester carboxylesterase